MSSVQPPAAVPRTLGLIDLVLLKVVAIVNVNNVPPTAVFGRASLLLWVLAFLAFFIPEALAVMVMVRRYPGEGGIYLWTRRLFGEGHGFFSGWCYWVNNLFYVPVLLVYIAGVAAFAAGERGAALIDRPWFAASVAFGWLIAMTVANVRGLGVGKWIQNIGGIGTALAVLLVVVAALALVPSGGTLVPPPAAGTGWEMAAGFSVMCFAFVGIELASTMGDEIRNPQRDLPRAIAISGAIAIASYLLVTGAVQALVPVRELGPIQGIMQAVAHGASLAGIRWIVAPIAVVMALSVGGAASAWFAGSSRVPFAAGLAHALPQALGRVHPRWGSPHVALITCAVLAALFATLSFVGSTVNEAYQVLLKASVAIQLVPFIYLFLGTMKLEGVGALTRAAGGLGLLVTIAGTFAAFLPPADVASVWVFELKMLAGVGGPSAVGWLLYWRTTRGARVDLAAGGAVPGADAPRADAPVREDSRMPRKNLAAAAVALVAVVTCALAWQTGWIPRLAWHRGAPNLLLVSIDTLRADRLGCYGYAAAQTPVLDALAGRGVRFAAATTVTPLTLPAHASLLTGTFPAYHGVRDNGGFYLDDDQQTLAETLKAHGYRTGGFVAAFVLDRRWGVGQGFDTYFDDFDLSRYDMSVGLDAAQRPGHEVVDRALAWIGTGAGPFFAWVHLYEPHSPYTPPEPYRSRFPSTMEGAYDGEIATADAEVGRLLAYLEAHGALANTVVIVVGDHGESLGEHREQQHGFFVYDASTQIPLIVAGPGLQSRVVRSQVRIVDVMPTALELLGVQTPATVQGTSLLPLARGEPRTLPALVETWYPRYHYGWSELSALRNGRYKFISAPRPELYDTDADPGETHDLSAANPRLAKAMANALRELEAKYAGTSGPQTPRPVDAAVEQQLRALGYVSSSVSRTVLERRPRGDPKDKIELYNLLKLAGQDSVSGRIADGLAKVRQVLAADPEVIEAYTMLGNMHTKAGRREEAIDAYRQALAVDAEHEGAAWSLALAYKNAGRLADAQSGFERVLQLDARSTKAMWQLADIWMRQGEFARAQRVLQQALAQDVDRAPFLVKLGESHIEQRQYDQARDRLLEAVKVKSTQPMAHYDLGLVHEARSEWDEAASAYRREIDISPKLYQPHFNLAKLLARAGRHGEAAAHFRQAIVLDPSFAEGHLYLAKTLLDTGDLSGAEAEARQGLAAGPKASAVALGHYVLADVYSRLGRPRDAAREAAAGLRLEKRARTSGRSPRS